MSPIRKEYSTGLCSVLINRVQGVPLIRQCIMKIFITHPYILKNSTKNILCEIRFGSRFWSKTANNVQYSSYAYVQFICICILADKL